MDFKTLVPKYEETEVKALGETLKVKTYLPTEDKVKLITFVAETSINEEFGNFSPVRTDVYFAIAVCQLYAGIQFDEEDLMNAPYTYDVLQTNGILDAILEAIPEDERTYIYNLVDDTIRGIEKYNYSILGMLNSANQQSELLSESTTQLLDKIGRAEGLENLAKIKDV